jgi:branched-chain amino acid transport system ATP-binding protein
MIAIEALSVDFGGVKALDGVSLTGQAGEVLGVVGPNGAGKTALFDAIGGAVSRTSGTVTLDGERIDGMRVHAIASRGVARTYQAPRLFLRMTAIENVAAGAYRLARSRAVVAQAVRDALALAGFAGSLSSLARDLSESERRRVEIARALVASPGVTLLDEPFAALDAAQRQELGSRLAAFARERKSVMLIAERDVADCANVCDRIVVLHAGSKIAEGAPAAIERDPDVRDAYLGVEWRQ